MLAPAAEYVLARAAAREGTHVSHVALTLAWRAAYPGQAVPKPVKEGRWGRLLEPGVDAGRVVVTPQGGGRGHPTLYAPRELATTLPLPADAGPKPRVFGEALERDAALAVAALRVALRKAVTPGGVEAPTIAAAWPAAHGVTMPATFRGRVPRVLEPAVATGRVVVERRQRHVYYRLADPSQLPAVSTGARDDNPALRACADAGGGTAAVATADADAADGTFFPSDLARIEEAVGRATAGPDSAVSIDAIEAARDAAPELATATRVRLATSVACLVACGRVMTVRPSMLPARPGRSHRYYALPGGPTQVRLACLTPIDRRAAAVAAYWRATRGRPFTTAALRKYTDERPAYGFTSEPAHAYTNALHHLHRRGELARLVDESDPRFVRWAPATEWDALSAAERAERLQDAYGREPVPTAATDAGADPVADGTPGGATERPDVVGACGTSGTRPATPGTAPRAASGITSNAPSHDVGFLSGNRDVAALVAATQAQLAAKQPRGEARRIVGARPVTPDDVAVVAAGRGYLARHGTVLARALWKASRVQASTVRAAVVKVGVVGRRTFYEPPARGRVCAGQRARPNAPSPGAVAYVTFVSALESAEPVRLGRSLARLREAAAYDVSGAIPLGPYVLGTRAAQLAAEARGQAAAITDALERADLLAPEVREAEALRDALTALARGAEDLAPTTVMDLPPAAAARHGTALNATARDGEASAARASVRALLHVPTLDVAAAAEQADGLAAYRLPTPRDFRARIVNLVRTMRPGEGPASELGAPDAPTATCVAGTRNEAAGGGTATGSDDHAGRNAGPDAVRETRARSGRAVTTYLDRVGFAAYAIPRYTASAVLGDLAARGGHAAGDLRWAAPFVRTLGDRTLRACHPAAAAALGLLDNPDARAAVAAYLRAALAPGALRPGGPGASGALATAVLALAPKPIGGVATALVTAEREALNAAEAGADAYVRGLAARVLAAWDEAWTRDCLLAF